MSGKLHAHGSAVAGSACGPVQAEETHSKAAVASMIFVAIRLRESASEGLDPRPPPNAPAGVVDTGRRGCGGYEGVSGTISGPRNTPLMGRLLPGSIPNRRVRRTHFN